MPNPFFDYLHRRFFDHIKVDETWVAAVREAAAQGSVVYVLRNLSFIDLLALDHLTKRFHLPEIRFAQDLGPWLLQPAGRGWLKALVPFVRKPERAMGDQLREALEQGGSAAMFLKRPPALLEQVSGTGRMRRSEGDEPLLALFRLQREQAAKPILLIPQTFVWTKNPDKFSVGPVDFLFGPREWPGRVRTVTQFLSNYRHVDFRAGEAFDLSTFLRDAAPEESDSTLVRRATYALLTRLERERRAILGPTKKPADRVRDEVIRSPKLQAVIHDLAGEGKAERTLLTLKAYGMLRELEAAPDPATLKGFEVILNLITHRIYAGVEVDRAGLEQVREAAKKGTIIFLPSHKSHIDYLILSYVLNEARIQLPLIAAGDNLSFFPIGPIFRRGGAFFIRRSFRGDRLYAAVVDAYLRRLVRDGWAIECFLEGGRSRTGKLLSPKLGLLTMVCDAALSIPHKPVTFVPMSIGYDRLLEERSYLWELTGGEKRKENARALLRSTHLLSGFYGRVNMQFGEPLTLGQIRSTLGLPPDGALSPAQRRAVVTRLGRLVMADINRITSVTPGAVVATALLAWGRRGITHHELFALCQRLVSTLHKQSVRMAKTLVTPSGALRAEAVREAAQLFVRGDLLIPHVPGAHFQEHHRTRAAIYTGDDIMYIVPDSKRLALSLSKNSIVHFFIERAVVATAMLPQPGPPLSRDLLRERVQVLSRLFKFEFIFRANASFDTIFQSAVTAMLHESEIAPNPEAPAALTFGAGHDGLDGRKWVSFYADLLRPFLESYRIAARSLTLLRKGPLSQKELIKRALNIGERMFLTGDIERREAISRPILETGLLALHEQQYLRSSGGKLELAPSFQSSDTVAAIETRIRTFLVDLPKGENS